ncbi:unnamed protein product [Ixodes hexagonus]
MAACGDLPRFGMDSRWSWITLGFCSWVLFMDTLSLKAFGTLFYGVIETFQTSRNEASWPFTVADAVSSFAGPLFGYLCRRYSCRKVLLLSSFFCGIGVLACYFATSVTFLVVFFGVVHGKYPHIRCSLAGVLIGVNVLVIEHFEKRRATACGVMYTVACLNAFVVPPLVEFFRSHYSTRSAFLLLGALILNGFPGTLALHSPAKTVSADSSAATVQTSDSIASAEASVNGGLSVEAVSTRCFKDGSTPLVPKGEPGRHGFRATVGNILTCDFWVNAFSYSMVYFDLVTFMMVAVDLASDRKIAPSLSVFLFHTFTVGDAIMRTLSGIVVDSGYLRLQTVMGLGFFFQGVAFQSMVRATELWSLLACSLLLGFSTGSRICLTTIDIVRHFGVETLPVMLGTMTFVAGVFTMLRPPLVGYFRDLLGTYDGFLHILTATNLTMAAVWTIRYFFERRRERTSTFD